MAINAIPLSTLYFFPTFFAARFARFATFWRRLDADVRFDGICLEQH